MELVVEQTNLYAKQTMEQAAYERWTPVTDQEMWAYLGFSILMGINHLPSLADYWKSDEIYRYPPVADRISRDRFFDLSRYLHFTDNTTLPQRGHPNYNRLQKVQSVIDAVLEACLSTYNPNKNLSIDEAMIAFKGRSSIKQYMPKKPTKRGIKVWVRSDSSNGYICQFSVYTGKENGTEEVGLGCNVVKKLTNTISGNWYRVFMDNFFTSVPLFQHLLNQQIYACGTLRNNRKHLPADMREISKKGLAVRGDFVFRQDQNLVMTVWQDTKPVTLLSTLWDPEEVITVKRKRKDGTILDIQCPAVVNTYNQNMGGVDRGDQYRKYYEIRMKSRKVYKYVFWFLVEVCILNTYQMYRYTGCTGKVLSTFKDFRVELAKELIGSYCGRKRRGRPLSVLPPHMDRQFTLAHFPMKQSKGRCIYCQRNGQRKETTWFCRGCNMRLCHTGIDTTDCFIKFHTYCGLYEQ